MSNTRIRVLIVDDSAIARRVITESLARFPEIEVVGTAMDPYVARDRILELKPDVITLDIEMPKMDGLTFLKLIMQHRPMPVIIMSSLTKECSAKAMEALQAGAVDVLDKPNGSYSAYEDGTRLASKIKAASMARIRRSSLAPESASTANTQAPPVRTSDPARGLHPRSLILIGSSTGGPEALNRVVTSLPADSPPICIAQHIPAHFSRAMAERLDKVSAVRVKEAEAGDILKPGLALVAPGGFHTILKWTGSHYVVDLNQGPPLHHQRPAVDVLFDSVIKAGGAAHVVAAILTGMGVDGAAGLKKLRDAGAATVAQDEETCVVFGMPKEAIRLGAAQHVVPLQKIGWQIDRLVTQQCGRGGAVKRAA